MDKLKNVPTRIKNFAVRHKTGIAVTATALTCLALNRVALKQHDEFLASKGLLDEFYTPSDDEM